MCTVFRRNCDRYFGGTALPQDTVSRGCGSVCHGTAELPSAGVKKCHAAFMGKSKRLFTESVYGYFPCNDLYLVLQKFDIHFNIVNDSKDSMLALISNGLVPLFAPLGLGDWRICTSLISGVMAKESVISTLEILFGGNVQAALSDAAAASLLVFSLLYTPCVAALASIRRELGRKWVAGVIVWQCLVAWVAAFLVHGLALLF